jgi:histidine ammonia-lyase
MKRLTVKDMYHHLQTKTIPSVWTEQKSRIEADYSHFQRMLNQENPPHIYGVNTLVGHLDTESLSVREAEKFQDELIQNHYIGTAPYFDEFAARCIGAVKINQIKSGGSSISPELYQLLLETVFNEDFQPNIPMHASYSSGDVIPGAHWAYDLQQYLSKKSAYTFKPKEGISLINGSYVHAGYVLSLFGPLNEVWKHVVYNSFFNALLVKANPSNYTDLLYTDNVPVLKIQKRLLSLLKKKKDYKKQDPVSVRSLPQVLMTLYDSIHSLKKVLEIEINKRSDNPLIAHEAEEPLSQGSFLAPGLTVETSKLIESLLMTMWHVERRVHYLLSGEVDGIPANGSSRENPLGFIQIPKLLTATLEEARFEGGRRSFASGGSTSYGVEDFWTYGVQTAHVLSKLINKLAYMVSVEQIVSAKLYRTFASGEIPSDFSVPEIKEEAFPILSQEYTRHILQGKNTIADPYTDISFL